MSQIFAPHVPQFNQSMITLLSAVLKDNNVLNFLNQIHFINSQCPHSEIQRALQNYFDVKDEIEPKQDTELSIHVTSQIFPEISVNKIRSMYDAFGSASNTAEIVIRRLLKKIAVENSITRKEATKKRKSLNDCASVCSENNLKNDQPSTSKQDVRINSNKKPKLIVDDQVPSTSGMSDMSYIVMENEKKIRFDSENAVSFVNNDLEKLLKCTSGCEFPEEINNTNSTDVTNSKGKSNVKDAFLLPKETRSLSTENDLLGFIELLTTDIVHSKDKPVDDERHHSRVSKDGIPKNNDILSEGAEIQKQVETRTELEAANNLLNKKSFSEEPPAENKTERIAPINNEANRATLDNKLPVHLTMNEEENNDGVDMDTGEIFHNVEDDVFEIIEINIANAVDDALVYRLLEIFPEADPDYIRNLCIGKKNHPGVIDELITYILELDYPKRAKAASPVNAITADEQLEIMKQILPDADPNFLKIHCDRLIDKPDELKTFIEELVEVRNYPTLKDFLRKQQISAQQKQYTTEFSVEKFLEVIPDPVSHFKNLKPNHYRLSYEGQHYILCFLRNHFDRTSIQAIRVEFKKSGMNMLQTFEVLKVLNTTRKMRSKRPPVKMPEPLQDIPLLQEIAFVQHHDDILQFIKQREANEKQEREKAKLEGVLKTCSCCYDEEIMPRDVVYCENGCIFCKSCVQKSVEVSFGEGKLNFDCLSGCDIQFSLQVLQAVLPPKLFSKIALKKQVEEVKAAGLDDLESCPFCEFVTIPPKGDKLFRCLNAECMKESCRQCKEPSHLPLRCEEVEKENDVKVRTYIEDKMTEALLTKCYKCGVKFIKEDGCNKMTCSCGARMCYVCKQPVKDYKHFNGLGGDQTQLCPLYSDTHKLHQKAVLEGAQIAKQEVGVNGDPSKLKIDPTSDIKDHYKKISTKNPVHPNVIAHENRHLHHPVINQVGIFRPNPERRPLVVGPVGRHRHHQRPRPTEYRGPPRD